MKSYRRSLADSKVGGTNLNISGRNTGVTSLPPTFDTTKEQRCTRCTVLFGGEFSPHYITRGNRNLVLCDWCMEDLKKLKRGKKFKLYDFEDGVKNKRGTRAKYNYIEEDL